MIKHKGEFNLIGIIDSEAKIINHKGTDALQFTLLVNIKTKDKLLIKSLYTIIYRVKNVSVYLLYLRKGKFLEIIGDVQFDSEGNILKSLEATSLTFLN